jgi:sterol desaturase/sphingolipid hydroxylase (fatty acid hydroxylase superfamily)
VAHIFAQLANPSERLYWGYLISALALAGFAYLGSAERSRGIGFVRYAFPRQVWLHRSALLDYVYVGLTTVLWATLVAPYLLKSATVQSWLNSLLDPDPVQAALHAEPTLAIVSLYTVALVVVDDFRRYLVHRLFHSVPALWEFHKVHHSARVLTPITLYRTHPVEMLLDGLAAALAIGGVTAIFLVWFPGGLTPLTILGANAVRFVFEFFGANLRHSHIWLRFGSTLEHFIISPAQHQIHHSSESKHFNRNLGSQFALWDWAFGTLYVPAARESLVLGLGPRDDERLSTLARLYLWPFRGAWATLVNNSSTVQADDDTVRPSL